MKKLAFSIFCVLLFSFPHFNYVNSTEQIIMETFEISEESSVGFEGKVRISGLKKKHQYQLTINGYEGHESNEYLKKYDQTNDKKEGYYDFLKTYSNGDGVLEISFKKKLAKKGFYKVKFLLKDIKSNWLTVLSEDKVYFTVIDSTEQKD